MSSEFKIKVNDGQSVTAILYPAAKSKRAAVTVVLGHGAGADQNSSFMRMAAADLAARGFDVVTFNFLYKEQGRNAPDPKAKLESCYRAVIEAVIEHRQLKGNKLIIGGKSMGGRIASQVVAEQSEGIDGLVFLGYPLHPPGRLDKLRDAHLATIKVPMLFVQGSRDAFGNEHESKTTIKKHRLPATLYPIEGGDHSFKVPKRTGVVQQDVYAAAFEKFDQWARKI